MLRLPISIRDMLTCWSDPPRTPAPADAAALDDPRRRRWRAAAGGHGTAGMRLLPHPKIVGPAAQRHTAHLSSCRTAGVSCMDIDGGDDGTLGGSPPRYLLAGSGGGDCSVSLYDLSHFGSEGHLYRESRRRRPGQSGRRTADMSATHRPVARSIRHAVDPASTNGGGEGASAEAIGGVPSGHRQPLLGVHLAWRHWRPGTVYRHKSSSGILFTEPFFFKYCYIAAKVLFTS